MSDAGAMTDREPTTITVVIKGCAERILVERTPHGIVLRKPDHWEQRLSLQEAWELAEAIDALSEPAGVQKLIRPR